MHGLTHGSDYGFKIKAILEELIGSKVVLEALIDSKKPFNVI